MADLTKHLLKARQALDKRNYDYCLEVCEECQEIDPANLEIYKLLVEVAKKKSKESSKSSGFLKLGSMSIPALSKDPHKQLTAAVKRVSKTPDLKAFAQAGDAALKVAQTGAKALNDVAVFYYEEARATGLFNADVLFNLGNLLYAKFKDTNDIAHLDKALKIIAELEHAKPDHPTASKLARDWQAALSMRSRSDKAAASKGTGDFRSQVNSGDAARRAEVMNRIIRTPEDAKEVLGFIEVDLSANPSDKQAWVKKGDIHLRFTQFADARGAFEAAQRIDPHDFVVAMRIGDVRMAEARAAVEKLEQSGQDAAAAKQQFLQVEIEEYKKRVERQPTDMAHRFNLAQRYLKTGQIEPGAAELQQTVRDARYRRDSHFYLGFCFTKKGLTDLAIQQYEACLKLFEDDQADRAKDARYARGRLFEQLGKKAEAKIDYNRLVEIDMAYKDVATRLAALDGPG
jgi:tetratricopeptide (TPR) repeat protein